MPADPVLARELGGIQTKLAAIDSTLVSIERDRKEERKSDRDEWERWRSGFQEGLEHLRTTTEASLNPIAKVVAEQTVKLDEHIKSDEKTHKNIWRILGPIATAGAAAAGWANTAKSAVRNLFQ